MKILIAGAGYLGTEIARLASPHHEVITVTKSGDESHEACDLSDPTQVAELAKKHPSLDLIIHCASSGRGGPEAYRAVFIQGAKNLLQSFPNSHLTLTSSTSVYHQTDGSEVDESSPTLPIRETSQLLLEAEQIVLQSGGTIARLAGLYGPGRSVVLRKFLDHSAIIEESGQRILNQIHLIDAAAAALHLATQKHPGTFNVSDDRPITQLECYQGLADFFKQPLPPIGEKNLSSKRAWTHKKVLNAKIRATGWTPSFPSYFDALDSLNATS
ncbi:MAG: nucleoside-diphosphate-sugar epimerase [Akkermansiaceae bacterium]|jgi:nucleoside-diphosphate-sugar epimerase